MESSNMYEYTKQDVMEFLGTDKDRTDNLKTMLKTKGFTAKTNGKRGANLRFELDKELKKEVDKWTELFGFEPSRKTAVKTLLLFLHEQGKPVFMTDEELAFYTGQESAGTVQKARQELIQAGYIVETKVQRQFYKMGDTTRAEHYIGGTAVQSNAVANYFEQAEFKTLDKLEQFVVSDDDMRDARKEAMKEQVKERGAYYMLYRKELAKVLTPEQVLFLQE